MVAKVDFEGNPNKFLQFQGNAIRLMVFSTEKTHGFY